MSIRYRLRLRNSWHAGRAVLCRRFLGYDKGCRRIEAVQEGKSGEILLL